MTTKRKITICTSYFTPFSEDGEWMDGDVRSTRATEYDEHVFDLRTSRQATSWAIELLELTGAVEPSCGPHWGGPGTWYATMPYETYQVELGEQCEITAHLSGFSDTESKIIYGAVTNSKVERVA